MLIRREWKELRQGDMIYIPFFKIHGIFKVVCKDGSAEIIDKNTRDFLYCSTKWRVMRHEDFYPYHICVRGVQTGEVTWHSVKVVTS